MGDNNVYFGEIILRVKGEELYKLELFSRSEKVEEFKAKCAKITVSVKIQN